MIMRQRVIGIDPKGIRLLDQTAGCRYIVAGTASQTCGSALKCAGVPSDFARKVTRFSEAPLLVAEKKPAET